MDFAYSFCISVFHSYRVAGMSDKKDKKKKRKQDRTLAQKADPHHCYELSVQHAPSEIDFVDATFKSLRGRRAALLREDFCGTANVCCEWVRRRKDNRAIGVDIDAEVLAWGTEHNLSKLTRNQRERVKLLQADVMTAETDPPEMILAMNFSYWMFKERAALKRYFSRVHSALAKDGVLFMDAYGGYDSFRALREKRKVKEGGFTYIWEHDHFDPVNNGLLCHIHFKFRDGSHLKRAFSYDWRFWTLPELRDVLLETGFSNVTIYWQGWDKDGEPDGEFKPVKKAEGDAGWVCYLSAEK